MKLPEAIYKILFNLFQLVLYLGALYMVVKCTNPQALP